MRRAGAVRDLTRVLLSARARELREQDGGERSVHHEVGVALDLGRVRVVVVDAVRVGGDRGEAEEQFGVGDALLDPLVIG